MSYKVQEILFAVVMLLAGLVLLLHTYSAQYQMLLTGDGEIGPMFYPRIILYGWCVMAAGMVVQAARLQAGIVKAFNVKKVAQAIVLMFALLGLILCFGFIVAAVPFVYCFARFLGYPHRAKAIAAAIIIPVLLWLVFDKGLGVILPAPVWSFF